MEPVQTQTLPHALREERDSSRNTLTYIIVWALLCVGVEVALAAFVIRLSYGGWWLNTLGWLFLAPLVAGPILWLLGPTPSRGIWVRSLLDLADPKAIGALARAGVFGTRTIRRRAQATIARLLPRCGAEEYADMEPHQRLCLFELLNAKPGKGVTGLPVDIARFLERAGDAEALPYLRRAAQRKKYPALMEAASRAVEAIVGTERDVAAPERLLRPAGSAGESALLRPAGRGEDAEPVVLLRPSSVDES
jgi:hypothetical protein